MVDKKGLALARVTLRKRMWGKDCQFCANLQHYQSQQQLLVLDKRIKLCSRWSLWAGQTNLVTTPVHTLLKFASKMKTRIFHKTCLLWPGPDNAGWETLQKVLCSFTDLAKHENLFRFSKSPPCCKPDWCGSKWWQVSPISCGQQSKPIWEGGG